jgi:hypothetical protein
LTAPSSQARRRSKGLRKSPLPNVAVDLDHRTTPTRRDAKLVELAQPTCRVQIRQLIAHRKVQCVDLRREVPQWAKVHVPTKRRVGLSSGDLEPWKCDLEHPRHRHLLGSLELRDPRKGECLHVPGV